MKITMSELVKSPEKIYRLNKEHKTQCKHCPTLTWGDVCRKCSRKIARNLRKHKEQPTL